MKNNDLLTADLHLTDNPAEDYRWLIFGTIIKISIENNITRIFILGDLTDRKDRHSAKLLNRLLTVLKDVASETDATIIILMGNHDMPLNGTPYWSFLTALDIQYITEPVLWKGVWLLPFTSDPASNWKELDLFNCSAIFMHQTVAGSVVDGDRVISTAPHPMPLMPRGVPVYSGDVHRPQNIAGVTYVGAPHPVRYSETWRNRIIVIKQEDFIHPVEMFVHSVKRGILDISSTSELAQLQYRQGDQVRVRYHLVSSRMTHWPVEEEAIRQWAAEKGIVLASVEAILTEDIKASTVEKEQALEVLRPEDVVRSYSSEEKLDPEVEQMGVDLLKEAASA